MAAMTVEDIRAALDGGSTRGGRALFHLNAARRPGSGVTSRQQAFLRAVVDEGSVSTVSVPQHPEQEARLRPRESGDGRGDLTPAELTWLQRLPLDASAVTFDDAVRLAELAAAVSAMKAPSSARLVESIWGPVRAIHDEQIAEANLERARSQPATSVPPETEGAILDALIAVHGDLSEPALRAQARDLIDEVVRKEEQRYASEVARCEQELATIRAGSARATETQRAVPA